ncbi:MAG: radical SAM protein [Brevundimonas sp.]|uniref:radical SAM protein n=1 Tax=Brevundimonas sp. TaxID=1871086 RepID=UPI0025C0A617|nr:radical SAM/SPASM domain-containing protein [Brevundimonas sp.]MBX3477341.1 radical SAM protein [Brevundimonas sp.]
MSAPSPVLVRRGGPNPSVSGAADPASLTPIRSPAGGVFCRETLNLPAGPHTLRMQVQLSPLAEHQTLALTAVRGDVILARAVLERGMPDASEAADGLILSFHLAEPGEVTVEGVADSHAGTTHLRFLTQAPVDDYRGNEALFRFFPEGDAEGLPIKNVIFGTTAVCNANCFHCPTNKAYSRTQAKGWMDPDLFERVVDELAAIGFKGGVVFGLFGEPLQDPLFPRRMQYIRERLPEAILTLSTNGALYDSDRHREALALADDVAVHVEAASPEVYAASMRPLKAGRTFPRVERLLEDRAGKPAHVVAPIHRRNLEEVAPLRDAWESRGAGRTVFPFLMNRAGQADAFDEVALAPGATGCSPDILSDLVVDWDGTVLTCCQDFHRRSIIGNLRSQSLAEVLAGSARRRMYDALNDKRWNAIPTCAGCKNDCENTIDALVADRLRKGDAARTFRAREFQAKGAAATGPDVLTVSARRSLAQRLRHPLARKPRAVIFGPYKPLFPGRYRLRFDLANLAAEAGGRLLFEVVSPSAILASLPVAGPREGQVFEMEVEVPAHAPLEFRVRAGGVSFEFRGVSSVRLEPQAGGRRNRPGWT